MIAVTTTGTEKTLRQGNLKVLTEAVRLLNAKHVQIKQQPT